MSAFGGIESGGSKWNLAIATAPGEPTASATIPTTTPAETIDRAAAFFEREGPVEAIGIGSFGPVDTNVDSTTWGYVTTTPKPGWAHTDVGGRIARRLSVPVAFDTDVNAAALGEHCLGAARGLDTFCYITVGTGVGGGGLANGRLMHGLLHPELGHMRIPHDRVRDPFDGACPYHGDCLEGLASGEAIRQRWGLSADQLDDDAAWELEAEYLALGIVNVVCMLSPQRVVIGGGVMKQPVLLPLTRRRVRQLLAGYVDVPQLLEGVDDYIVPPSLGDRAGVVGALELARRLLPNEPEGSARPGAQPTTREVSAHGPT